MPFRSAPIPLDSGFPRPGTPRPRSGRDHKADAFGRQHSLPRSSNRQALERRATIEAIQAEGVTTARGIARALNDRGILTSHREHWDDTLQIIRQERRRGQRGRDG
jgi:hypothetical protein